MKVIFWILFTIIISLFITLIVLTITRLHEKFSNIDPIIAKLYANLSKIDPSIARKITIKNAAKSYTINKKHIHLCVREKKGEYFNNNMLMYVLLHECAHVQSKSVGHTKEFHTKFDKLLEKAEKLGFYDKDIPLIENYIDKCII